MSYSVIHCCCFFLVKYSQLNIFKILKRLNKNIFEGTSKALHLRIEGLMLVFLTFQLLKGNLDHYIGPC